MRVAILGAGPGGIGTAVYLKDQGVDDVVLFEKRDRLGGMTCTITVDGKAFDVGANYLTPYYTETLRLAEMVGMSTHVSPMRRSFDLATGNFHSTFTSISRGVSKLGLFAGTAWYYAQLLRYRDFIDTPGFGGVQQLTDLHVPLGAWFDAAGHGDARSLFTIPIEVFGYGNLDEVPVPYVLKYMNRQSFTTALMVGMGIDTGWPKQFDQGYQVLFQRLAGLYELDVRLGSEVTRIDRRDRITMHLANGHEEVFDALVVACPPTAAVPLFVDDAAQEHALFGRLRYRDYWVSAYRVEGMPDHLLDEIQVPPNPHLPPAGHPWGVSKMWADVDVVLYYTVVEQGTSEDDVDRLIREDTNRMGGDVGELIVREKWDRYFPHVASTDLAAGWFEQVEAMQGEHATWYTGGAMASETIEPILRYTQDLVQRMLGAS